MFKNLLWSSVHCYGLIAKNQKPSECHFDYVSIQWNSKEPETSVDLYLQTWVETGPSELTGGQNRFLSIFCRILGVLELMPANRWVRPVTDMAGCRLQEIPKLVLAHGGQSWGPVPLIHTRIQRNSQVDVEQDVFMGNLCKQNSLVFPLVSQYSIQKIILIALLFQEAEEEIIKGQYSELKSCEEGSYESCSYSLTLNVRLLITSAIRTNLAAFIFAYSVNSHNSISISNE